MNRTKGPKKRGPLTKDFTLQDIANVGCRLSAQHRAVLTEVISGTPYKEIAAKLSLNEGTIKSRASRARAALHKQIEKDKLGSSVIRVQEQEARH